MSAIRTRGSTGRTEARGAEARVSFRMTVIIVHFFFEIQNLLRPRQLLIRPVGIATGPRKPGHDSERKEKNGGIRKKIWKTPGGAKMENIISSGIASYWEVVPQPCNDVVITNSFIVICWSGTSPCIGPISSSKKRVNRLGGCILRTSRARPLGGGGQQLLLNWTFFETSHHGTKRPHQAGTKICERRTWNHVARRQASRFPLSKPGSLSQGHPQSVSSSRCRQKGNEREVSPERSVVYNRDKTLLSLDRDIALVLNVPRTNKCGLHLLLLTLIPRCVRKILWSYFWSWFHSRPWILRNWVSERKKSSSCIIMNRRKWINPSTSHYGV